MKKLFLITLTCFISFLVTVNVLVAQSNPARPYQINFYVYLGKMLGATSPENAAYEFSYKIDRIVIHDNAGGKAGTAFETYVKSNGIISGEVNAGADLWITVRLKGGGQIVKEEKIQIPTPHGTGTFKKNIYFLKDKNYLIVDEKNYEYYRQNN